MECDAERRPLGMCRRMCHRSDQSGRIHKDTDREVDMRHTDNTARPRGHSSVDAWTHMDRLLGANPSGGAQQQSKAAALRVQSMYCMHYSHSQLAQPPVRQLCHFVHCCRSAIMPVVVFLSVCRCSALVSTAALLSCPALGGALDLSQQARLLVQCSLRWRLVAVDLTPIESDQTRGCSRTRR